MEGSNKKGSRRGYGSSMFPFGSPINSSRRSVLSPGALQSPAPPTSSSSGGEAGASPHVLRGRLRAQDVYGGPVAFGGTPSGSRGQARKSMLDGNNITGRSFNADYSSLMGKGSGGGGQANGLSETTLGGGHSRPGTPHAAAGLRKSRLMFSASPYHSAASARIGQRKTAAAAAGPAAVRSNTPSPSSCGSSAASSAPASTAAAGADGMSSTARLILETLDKMSTPLRDAQKMLPFDGGEMTTPSRAEKRKQIAQQFGLSQETPSSAAKRRRPNLGTRQGGGADASMLKGPPTRSTAFMSPTPAARAKGPRDPPPLPKPVVEKAASKANEEKVAKAPPPPPPVQLQFGVGGGKIKSTAKSSLRPPAAPKLPTEQPPPPSSSQLSPMTMAAMPNITFAPSKNPRSQTQPETQPVTQLTPAAATAPSRLFAFSLPEKVGDGGLDLSEMRPSASGFQFAAPQRINKSGAAATESKSSVLPDLMTLSSGGPQQHKVMPVMKMPSADVAPKPALLKSGSVMQLLGGNSVKLPDVTSTGRQSSANMFGGIKPAAELKTGSVMSILGKSGVETPAWDPKFKTNQKPW